MKVALVYPPLADATQPYSSLAALAGFLRSRGHHDLVLQDANVEFVLRTLTREHMIAAASGLTDDNPLASVRLKAPVVCAGIDAAVADLRSRETYSNLGRLNHARRIVQDAWEILNETELGVRPETWSAAELDRLARGRGANPFFSYLEEISLPALESNAPDAVGISITYRSQILPAITLALLVKQRMPAVTVIFGGQIASLWHPLLPAVPQLFDWCDYLIAFEGETALEALLSSLERGTSPDDVPNLAYRRDGHVLVNPLFVEDIDDLPAPDYRGLPLDRYLASEPVFVLNTSRGCYWSKCEFCSVSPSMRHRFRARRPELVLNDIATLQARHAAHCISFGDDCVPPRMLKALSRGLRERGLDVSWQCEVRFEPQLDSSLLAELREAGCRNLIFGLESYVPRVLESMNKGVRHREIQRILDECRRHEIAFNLQLFFGFPGETAKEARRTVEFVVDEMYGAATFSFGTFRLQRGSGAALHPEAFGIRIADGQQPLALALAYEPLPPHAEEARQALRSIVLERAGFQSLPLCIDAHTLLYLHRSGVPAMAKDYYPSAVEMTPDAKLTRRSGQTITETTESIVLYDYELDRAAEISQLARWLLEQFERPRSARDLARKLARATGEPASQLLPTVTEITGALLERGMLVGV